MKSKNKKNKNKKSKQKPEPKPYNPYENISKDDVVILRAEIGNKLANALLRLAGASDNVVEVVRELNRVLTIKKEVEQ